MNKEKKNQMFLLVIVILLLIGVLLAGIYFYTNKEKQEKNEDILRFHQIYSSAYDLVAVDSFYLGIYNEKIAAIIDNTGKEIYNATYDIYYTGFYPLEDGRYLFYGIKNGELHTYIYENKTLKESVTYRNISSFKPVLYQDKDKRYLIGFSSYEEGNTFFFKIEEENAYFFENISFVGDILNDTAIITKNRNYIVSKDSSGDFGVVSFSKEEILPFIYEDISINENLFIIKKENKYSLINEEGEEILKNVSVLASYTDYLLAVNKQNKMALYSIKEGKMSSYTMKYNPQTLYNSKSTMNTIELYTFDTLTVVVNNHLSFMEGNVYFIYSDKVEEVEEEHVSVGDFIVVLKDKTITVYDLEGNVYATFTVDIDSITSIETKKDFIFIHSEEGTYVYTVVGSYITNVKSKIVSYKEDYYLTKEGDSISLYNKEGTLVDSLEGKNIEVQDKQVLVDYSIYSIVKK